MGITARILKREHYLRGYTVDEFPDVVELKFKGSVVARFNPTKVTIATLNDSADRHYNELMSGVEFGRV